MANRKKRSQKRKKKKGNDNWRNHRHNVPPGTRPPISAVPVSAPAPQTQTEVSAWSSSSFEDSESSSNNGNAQPAYLPALEDEVPSASSSAYPPLNVNTAREELHNDYNVSRHVAPAVPPNSRPTLYRRQTAPPDSVTLQIMYLQMEVAILTGERNEARERVEELEGVIGPLVRERDYARDTAEEYEGENLVLQDSVDELRMENEEMKAKLQDPLAELRKENEEMRAKLQRVETYSRLLRAEFSD